ncbi:MAG: CDP-alcohol phosphatidyltransferase family protein [Cellulosilyticaceae bacterium]
MSKKEIFSIPNILSAVRIALIPVFVVIYMNATTHEAFYAAAGVLLLSGITDLLDGYIARHYNMITDLGKVLDPLADKLTQGTVAICLAMHIQRMGILLGAFVIKELIMIIGGAFLIGKGAKLDGAKWFGKLATVIFYFVMFLVVAVPNMERSVINILIMISLGFMLFAFGMYVPEFIGYWKKTEK